jgi:hypothetical protein
MLSDEVRQTICLMTWFKTTSRFPRHGRVPVQQRYLAQKEIVWMIARVPLSWRAAIERCWTRHWEVRKREILRAAAKSNACAGIFSKYRRRRFGNGCRAAGQVAYRQALRAERAPGIGRA